MGKNIKFSLVDCERKIRFTTTLNIWKLDYEEKRAFFLSIGLLGGTSVLGVFFCVG